MTWARRFLTLVAFAFWQGGFTFYAAIVVPIGMDVLNGPTSQGMITRRVAVWINVAGGAALCFMAWDAVATRYFRRGRLLTCVLMAVGLLALTMLHPRLDALIDPLAERVSDRAAFHAMHRIYLWISTGIWGLALIYLALTPVAWRRADRLALKE